MASRTVGYLIGDALFTGDTLFMPDYGTARCDFPGGSSKMLYESIQRTGDVGWFGRQPSFF